MENNSRNVSLPSSPLDVLDLTETDDYMDDIITHEAEDTKINPNESAFPSMVAANSNAYTNDINVNQSNNPHMQDDFWSGIYLSTFGTSLNSQPTANHGASHIPPDANVSSAPTEAFHGNSPVLSDMPSPNALQLQQYQFGGNPAFTGEYGRLPQLQPSNVTRTPIAVQALPAVQMSYPAPQQQRSRIYSHPQVPPMSMTLNQHPPGFQPQQNPNAQTPNHAGQAYRTSNEYHNLNQQQQMANIRMSQAPVQSPLSMQQPSSNFRWSPNNVGVLLDNRGSYPTSQQANLVAAANQAVFMSIDSSRAIPAYTMNNNPVNNGIRMSSSPQEGQRENVGVLPQPAMRSDSNGLSDLNWRPAGRMRGALTGQAYSDAMNQYIIQPIQQAQAQAARPPNQSLAGPSSRPGM